MVWHMSSNALFFQLSRRIKLVNITKTELCSWKEIFFFMNINIFYREKKYFSSWKEFENKLKSTSPNSRFSLLFTLIKHAENDKIAAHRLSYPALNLLDYSKDIGL